MKCYKKMYVNSGYGWAEGSWTTFKKLLPEFSRMNMYYFYF